MSIPSVRDRLSVDDREDVEAQGLPPAIRTALLEALFASGSDSLILPIQDLFGWTDRINQPATISDLNWTWRLPWLSDRLLVEEEPVAMAARAAEWARRYQRQGDARP
jgi:4-alpha-glucanotransferase